MKTLRAAALIGLLPGQGLAGAAERIDWRADLAFFQRELPAGHRNLFFRTERAAFERAVAALERDAASLSDVEVALRLQALTVALGDDHTAVNTTPLLQANETLPLGVHWFADGWRVLTVERKHASLLGAKLTAMGGVPMAEVEARLGQLISAHNPWLVKTRLPQTLPAAAVLRFFKLADDRVTLTTQREDGGVAETEVPISTVAPANRQLVQFRPKVAIDAHANQRTVLRHKLHEAERIFYVQYNRCEGASLDEMFGQILGELKAAVDAGRVAAFVFDVRFNPGGDSRFGTRFAQQVAAIPQLRQRGRTFVIIGRRTFSSGILNAMDFKRLMAAEFVGEAASGTLNHFGELKTFVLPSSKLTVFYSTKFFGDPSGRMEPMPPDLKAEMTFADFDQGIDPALEAIKRRVSSSKM